jgi:hypothetical protein
VPKTIKMLRDFKVAPNGHTVETWLNGEVYPDVADDLAGDLIGARHAVEVTGDEKADEAAAEAARDALDLAALEAEEARLKAGEPKPAPTRKGR